MTIAGLLTSLRRVASRYRPVAMLVVGSLVLLAVPTTIVVVATVEADEQARIEAAAAQVLEQKFIDYYAGALERLQPLGTQLVDDATSWATSATPLLTAIDVSSLQSTADAVSGSLSRTPPPGATSAQLEELFNSQWAVIGGARVRMADFASRAATAAQAHVDAAPLADFASRQAVIDAQGALTAAVEDHASVTAPLTALTAAVVAVDAAQAAAVAAAEAAAAAAAAAAARTGGGVVRKAGEPTCSSDVLTCVNHIRAYYGLGGLSSSGALTSTAQACADRLGAPGAAFEHSSPPGGLWGENIARGYGSQVAVFNAWMGSAGHRANILRASFTKMGLGYATGNNWCQQFG